MGNFWHRFWRNLWYSFVLWIAMFLLSSIIIMPWFFLALPFLVYWTTVIYFKKGDKSLNSGLWCSLFWFFAMLALDIVQIAGPYYFNVGLYFSDVRNILKYPLILLIPVIYSLIQEARILKRRKHINIAPGL